MRNPHRAGYDFALLIKHCPELKGYLQPHPAGGDTVDFADPAAVLTLNRALLKTHYGLAHWDIPPGSLCPPIPSRADYLHHLADLLAADGGGGIPRGTDVRIIDIGAGANGVFAFIGAQAYDWRFVATDIDRVSIAWLRELVKANSAVAGRIECRRQPVPAAVFQNVVRPKESFAASVCNPPFHSSPEEAAAGTLRKLRNLGNAGPSKAVLNFGGQSNELWCDGGEVGFIQRMILESADRPELCNWFTTLVSKRGNLPLLERSLRKVRAGDVRVMTMFAGQKQSRVLAWSFLSARERAERPGGA